jgi:hypothetical protein
MRRRATARQDAQGWQPWPRMWPMVYLGRLEDTVALRACGFHVASNFHAANEAAVLRTTLRGTASA